MTDFLDAWSLFWTAWVTMTLAGIALAMPGIIIIGRGQVMLAVGAAQSAVCGAAVAMWLIGVVGGGHVHGDPRIYLGALLGGLLGTAFAWNGSSERTAWLFAVGSAASVLLIANSPYGMHDLMALQHSNALVAGLPDVVFFACIALTVVVLAFRFHREIRLLAIDPEHARACGVSLKLWNGVLGVGLGVVMSMAVSSLGLLFTFGCLVLPAMVTSLLCRHAWMLLVVTPVVAVGCVVAGVAGGHAYDLPPSQVSVMAMAALVPVGAIVAWVRRYRSRARD